MSEHAPDTRAVAYRPASGLTKFQKNVLVALDYERPQRAADLGLGDPRGVGSSIAALIDRGYASGDSRTGYTRNRTVTPRMHEVRVMYQCHRCGRIFYPFEVSKELDRHTRMGGKECSGHDTHFSTVDR